MALSTHSPETPRPPTAAEERPSPLTGPLSGPLSGAWWDAARQTAADTATHSDDLTERTVRLAVEELLRRVGPVDQLVHLADSQRAGVRPRPDTEAAQATQPGPVAISNSPVSPPEDVPHREEAPPRRKVGRAFDELFALLVLAAPLAVAGWFQAHAVHALLDGLPWPLAVAFTLAWEGGAAYCARLYLRALLRGDSTVVLRAGMIGYAAVSAGLLWLELHLEGKPPWLAGAVGALTASGIFLWSRRARDLRRDDLHRMGRVDRQVVKFSLAAWLLCPLETPAALRYAVKHRIEEPATAIERYRRHQTLRILRQARKQARIRQYEMKTSAVHPRPPRFRQAIHRRTTGGRAPYHTKTPNTLRRRFPPNNRPGARRPRGVRQGDLDARILARRFPGRVPGRNEVVRVMEWGKPKAKNAIDALRRSRAAGNL
jgi:hypothetical protein